MHQVIKLPARQRSAATHHADLLGNCQPWVHYHDDLSEVPSLKAEKRNTILCNTTVAEIDDPSVRVNYCEVDSRGTIMVWVRCDCAIGVRPKSAKSVTRGACTNSVVVESKNRDCCATELQAGDGLTGFVYDSNQVVVKAAIERGGRIGVSCCDRPVSVERDQNGTTLIGASVLISEICGINTRSWTASAAGNNGARLRLGKRRVRSHHQNDDAENKENPLPSACSFEQPCSSWAANSRMSYEGVPHIIDLGRSQAEAETEAQLVEQDFDPAAARPHIVRVSRNHPRPRPAHQTISSGPRQSASWTGFRRSRRRRAPPGPLDR